MTAANGGKRVVILGAGFAGLYTALHVQKKLGKNVPVDITLIDRNHFHLFTPLLHEAATGMIDLGLILTPIRRLLKGTRIRFVRARVETIDTQGRQVILCCGEQPYDILVIALGSVTNFYGLESVRERALEVKHARDADTIRCYVINHFEAATREGDPHQRRKLLTFTVVGGGCTGVEVVTELHEFVEHLAEEQYPHINPQEIRTVLVELQDCVLSSMAPALSAAALRRMTKMGIDVMLERAVTGLTDEGLTFAGGLDPLPTRTVIWAAGIEAPPVVRELPWGQDRVGRIVVNHDLTVPGNPNVYVMGDSGHARHPETGDVYPPTAQVAYRQAPVVAANIVADLMGSSHREFDFTYIGDLVSMGKFAGVANPFGLRLRGVIAWAMWKFYYLLTLVGWQNRLRVALNWLLALFFPMSSALSHECTPECEGGPCP